MSIEMELDYTSAQLIGDFIRKYRVEAGLSFPQLVKTTGFSERMLQQWEDGRAIPGRKNLAWIAQVIGAPFSETEDILPLCRRKSNTNASVKAAQRRWEARHKEEPVSLTREEVMAAREPLTKPPRPEIIVKDHVMPRRAMAKPFIPREVIEKVVEEVNAAVEIPPVTYEDVVDFAKTVDLSMIQRLELVHLFSANKVGDA